MSLSIKKKKQQTLNFPVSSNRIRTPKLAPLWVPMPAELSNFFVWSNTMSHKNKKNA